MSVKFLIEYKKNLSTRYDNSRVASCELRVVSREMVFNCVLRVASCELQVAS